MIFRDRVDAGKKLASMLPHYRLNAIVVAIPRGGVVVGKQVADELDVELDIIIPRKIGAPGNPELAIGAIAGEEAVLLNQRLVQELGVSENYIAGAVQKEREELQRREALYRQGLRRLEWKNKNCILVDDGLATGFTARAAIADLRSAAPAKIILAVPVAPKSTVDDMMPEIDEAVIVHSPSIFYAIGQFYEHFEQVSDQEVISLISMSGS